MSLDFEAFLHNLQFGVVVLRSCCRELCSCRDHLGDSVLTLYHWLKEIDCKVLYYWNDYAITS